MIMDKKATVDNLQYYYDTVGEYARINYIMIEDDADIPEVIIIPEELDGYLVVAIGNEGSRETEVYTFEQVATGLKEIVVPDTVVKLYFGAFSHLY